MSTLTSLLARDAVVSLDTIEQALQRQVLEGGEIDTALLELGALPENTLGAYRAALYQLLPAAREQLESIGAALLARVPAELAREYRLLPVAGDEGSLVLATDAPLSLSDAQRLGKKLNARLSFRIATELRIQAALAAHYGIDIPSRMRLLAERLRNADAGALIDVQPWMPSSPAPASRPAQNAPQNATAVRVVPVVTLGSRGGAPAKDNEALQTRPSRPSRQVGARARRSNRVPRGPMPRLNAIELLGQAHERDRVLEVFFAFARQYFECTVLFALRDERMLGVEAAGLPAPADVSALEVPIARGGAVQGLMQTRKPRVLDLCASLADQSLVDALGRAGNQPCALIPVAIRQRNVALLYGDRSGDPIALEELSELLETLPAVSGAFERLIHERKLQAVEAGRARARKDGAAPEGAFRPPATSNDAPALRGGATTTNDAPALRGSATTTNDAPRGATPRGMAKQHVQTSPRLPAREAEPEPAQRIELASDDDEAADRAAYDDARNVPKAPRVPVDAVPSYDDDEAARPTMQLQSEDIRTGLRPSSLPPSSTAYSARGAPTDSVRPRKREERTRPERPSKMPAPRLKSVPPPAQAQSQAQPQRRRSDPPPPRTLSQPPPGMGSYSVRDPASEVISMRPPRVPAQAETEADADREPHLTSVIPLAPDRAKDDKSTRATARSDPRRDGSSPGVPEVVTIPPATRESLRPPAPTSTGTTPQSITIDLDAEAERLVTELMRTGPDEEKPIVAALIRLGESALPALAKRFPGPLWFDRQKPRQRMPVGRDVSAIARALFAFEERALPHIVELLNAPQADVRLCATLLAADRVGAETMWPLYQRLFDPDGQVRLLAMEALPLFRNVRGFDEVLKSLREKSVDDREAIPGRLAALEAIFQLRDAGSVELLIKLYGSQNRQLSVPAHRSLLAITAQDFGDSERKWRGWFDKNRARHRAEWLIESLMHNEERVRTTAGLELQKLSQVYYGYVPSAGKRERERSQARYREWWEREGRLLFK
jgi:hypothetical protein